MSLALHLALRELVLHLALHELALHLAVHLALRELVLHLAVHELSIASRSAAIVLRHNSGTVLFFSQLFSPSLNSSAPKTRPWPQGDGVGQFLHPSSA